MAKSKQVQPMFWISGNYRDCRKIWDEIRSSVDNPNVVNLDCGLFVDKSAAKASDVITILKHRDMFDDRTRIIKMNNIPEDYAIIADYLYLVDDDNILVVDSPVGYRKKKFISAANSNFYKTIKTRGKAFIFDAEAKDERAAISWVKDAIKDLGKEIERDAAIFLVREVAGREYDLLYSHVRKLANYSDKKITEEDVKTCCLSAYQRSIGDLVDSLDYGRFDAVMKHLQEYYEHVGTEVGTTFEGELERLYGLLLTHFTALLLIKNACRDYLSYQCAIDALKPFKKRSKINDKWIWDRELYNARYIGALVNSRAFQSAFRWDKRRIYLINCDLHRARVYNRMTRSKAEARTNLDVFAMFVCGRISFEAAGAMREM